MWRLTYGIMYVRASIYGIKITITLYLCYILSLYLLISFVNPASKVNKYIRLFNF